MTVLNVRYVTFQNLKKKYPRHRRAADQRGTELAGAATRVHRVVADT
jgi:hypothetical protein